MADLTMDEIIKSIIGQFGTRILLDEKKFISVFVDMAPRLKNEKNILAVALSQNIARNFVDCPSNEHETVVRKTVRALEPIMSKTAIQTVVSAFTTALGWDNIIIEMVFPDEKELMGKSYENVSNGVLENEKISYTHTNQPITKNVDWKVRCDSFLLLLKRKKWDKAEQYITDLKREYSDSAIVIFFRFLLLYRQGKKVHSIAIDLQRLAPAILPCEEYCIEKEWYEDYFWMYAENGLVSRLKYILYEYPDLDGNRKFFKIIPSGDAEFYLLSYAVYLYNEDLQIIKTLLEAGIRTKSSFYTVKKKDYINNTYEEESHISVLNFAIMHNNLDLVKLLLKYGADPNSFRSYAKESKYSSAMADAIITAKSPEIVSLLLDYGADLKDSDCQYEKTKDGKSISKNMLICAIIDAKSPEIVKLLLDNGLDSNYSIAHQVEGNVWPPIFDAIEIKSIKIVQILLDHGAEPNSSKTIGYINGKSYGEPVLSYAVRSKTSAMVELLLKYGADATASRTFKNKYGTFKSSVLSDAIWQSQNPDMVKVLLENGANANHIETFVNEKGISYKRSMLSYAISNAQNIEMVKDLLKHGANPNTNKVVKVQKLEETTPLLIEAIQGKSVPIVKLLLEQNANVNVCKIKRNGSTKESIPALFFAITNNCSIEMIKLLLSYGADVNLCCSTKEQEIEGIVSPLSEAIRKNSFAIAEIILEKGADPDFGSSINEDSRKMQFSALGEAIKISHSAELVKLLIKHKAHANLVEKTENGSIVSLLTYAIVETRNTEIISVLLDAGANWDNEVTMRGKTKIERKFPYNKFLVGSKDFLSFLRSKGWKGSLF